MRSGACILAFIFVISFAIASPELKFQNEDIQTGETIFAQITLDNGTFQKEISDSSIKFFEGRREKYFDYNKVFFNGTYYLYIYAKEDGEFRLEINDVLYKENGGLDSVDFVKNFNISTVVYNDTENNGTYTKVLAIKPGFVYYPGTKKFRVFNVGTSSLDFKYDKEEYTLEPKESKEIEVFPDSKLSFLEISSYGDFEIPVIYPAFGSDFVSPLKKSDLRSSNSSIVAELISKDKKTYTIQLFNFGENNLTDFEISTGIDFLKTSKLDDMSARGVQNLTLQFDAREDGSFSGFVNISFSYGEDKNYISIPISAYVLPEGSTEEDLQELRDVENSDLECKEPFGRVCSDGYKCSEGRRFDKNRVYCCFAECIVDNDPHANGDGKSKYGWIIALVILVGLGGYGFYAYKKQKNIGKKNKPEDKIKESTENFEKRIASKPPSSRVSGNLTKS